MNLAPDTVFKSFNVKPIGKIGFTLLVFVMSVYGVKGADRFSVATGNWSSTSTWSTSSGGSSGASVPVAGDVVYIERGYTITVNVAAACASISFTNITNSSSTLSISGTNTLTVSGLITMVRPSNGYVHTINVGAGSLTAGSLTMSATTSSRPNVISISTGTVTINGTVTTGTTGCQFKFTGAGLLKFGGGFSGGPAALTPFTGTVEYTSASPVIQAFSGSYYNLKFSGTGTTSATGTITVQGNLANTGGGVLNFSSRPVIFSGTAAANSIVGFITTGTVSMTKTSGTATFTGNVNGGGITINGNGGTLNLGIGLTHTFSGTWTRTNGTLNGGSSILRIGGSVSGSSGTFTAGTGTVEWYLAGIQTVAGVVYNNLTLSGSSAKTLTNVGTINGNLTLSGTATATTAVAMAIKGNLVIGSTTSLTVGAYNFSVAGTTNISGIHTFSSATGTKTYTNNVTINNGGSWNETAAPNINFGGNLQNDGILTASTGVHSFTGATKTLSGTNTITIPNVTITGSYTNDGTLTVGTALLGGGTLSQGINGTLNIGGTSTITNLNATANGNTVNYNGAAQTVRPIGYYHLTLSGSSTKTLPNSTLALAGNLATSGTASATALAAINTAGNVTLGTGTTFNAGSFSHTVGGNWSKNGATFNASTSNYTFNGGSNQNIGGTASTIFNTITVYNSIGITLGNAISATGVTLTNGLVTTTSTNLLTVTGTNPSSITGSAASYINGPLSLTLPANLVNGSYSFPIGKTGYNPFELINANTTLAGPVVIKAEVSDANCGGTPGVGMSVLNTDSYWTTSITSGSGNFSNSQIRLTDTGMTSEYAIGQSATSSGTYDRISNNPPVGNTITSDPITTLSYFVIGKKPLVSIVATNDGTEGGGNGLFTLTTSRQFTIVRTINLVITGSATNGTDYTAINTTVNFPAYQNTVTVPVTITNDAIVEPTENVTITLAAGTGYAVGTPDNATVNIIDNDVAGFVVSPISGHTTEAGGTATFTVALNSQPSEDVSIGISSGNTNEGTVSTSSLIFTSSNWNTPQTVTVTGANDFIQDGDISYTIVTDPASSLDLNYKNLDPTDVTVINNDNDVAGITVSPTSGLTTTESGGTATFTLMLNSEPIDDVTIGLSSTNTNEGTVSPASVTFTPGNWNTAQTVTITGANDFMVDGNIAYTIATAAATSLDPLYLGKDASNVSVTNTDNDVAGVIAIPLIGLVTSETGTTATFTIALISKPSADVTIAISSDNTNEGTVSPSSVTFTDADWNTARTITITGVDDLTDDGNIVYHIGTSACTSVDSNYSGKFAQVITVTNNDNDTKGISISPTSLTTTEAAGTGHTKTFTVVLNTQPQPAAAQVTIGLSSNNTGEGTVSTSLLTFTNLNWNTPQTVTVNGVDEFIDDGDQVYSIITAAANGGDYTGVDAADVTVTNIDDDVVGIIVSPTSGLTTTELGGTATFTVKLNSKPTANVIIGISSGDTSEGTVSSPSLTFTTDNWNSTQTITVTGANDAVDDGNIAYTILTAAATGGDYAGINAIDVAVTNTDDDVSGVTVNPTSGLITTEAGGTATFTVKLNSEPTSSVIIGLTSNNTGEGTVSAATLTFLPSNWSTAQTVTVTGVDDFMVDGNVGYTILTVINSGSDLIYNAINPSDVSVTNNDNDVAGFTVTPTSGLTTTEALGAGHTATFTVKLNSQPSADVTIGISSNDVTEGTVSASSLRFTNANWNTVQTVTVTGVDDFVKDGNISYSIITAAATSTDGNYNNQNVPDVSLSNIDNDVAGITVNPTSGLTTTEAGGTAAFSIVLTSEPTVNVIIGISSSKPSEGTVSTPSVTFTPGNWNTAQTITITGAEDHVIDGNISYSIVTAPASSIDSNYNNLNPSDVSVTNTNIDVAGITVTPTSGLFTAEDGSQATFTIVMNTIPASNVIIGISSSDPTEGTVSATPVTFTPGNWSTPQTITITGADDLEDDGDIAYTVLTANASSSDANYTNFIVSDVSVTNSDNDVAGIIVDPIDGLITSEDLTTATFTIALNSKPAANVVINLSSDNPLEGTVSPASLTFIPDFWNTVQTVTITGKNDSQVDGDILYNIVTAQASSTDNKYNVINPDDVSVTNLDNDTPGITVSPISGLVTTEAGATASFTVVLDSEPSKDVTIDVSSGNPDEGTVSVTTLTFTKLNWSTAQIVTITGVNDALSDGDIVYSIILDAAVSDDLYYDGINPDDVSVTNLDRTPTISSFTPTTVCFGTGVSVVITGTFFTGTTSVKFNGVSASYVINSSSQITATLPATATTGTISVTTPTGTAVSGSSLTVNAISVGGTITGSTSVCSGTNNTTLTLSGHTGTVSKWQSSSVSNFGSGVTDILNTTTGLTVNNLTSTTYYRVVVNSGVCSSANSSVGTITVNPLPTASAGSVLAAICQGSTSVALDGTFGGGATAAVWSAPSGTFANNTGSTPGTATFTAAVNSTTPITLTLTTSGGSCSPISVSKQIVVNPNLPASVSIAASATTICSGTSVTFTATPTNGGASPTYQWKLNGSNVGSGTSTYTNASLANNNIVTCVMTSNATPCLTGSPATSNAVTMNVNQVPPAPIGTGSNICIGSTATLLASGAIVGEKYKWYDSASGGNLLKTSSNSTDNTFITPVLALTTNYWVSILSAAGCESSRNQVTATFPAASPDNQNAAGSDTWIGHVYDGTNLNTYYGNYTETETFDQNFGGAQSCFSITSNSTARSLYTEQFSVRYKMNSTKRGLYMADLGSDDGGRFTVDGTLIYNNWSDQAFIPRPDVLMSISGNSSLIYDFYENLGENRVVFQNFTQLLSNNLTINTIQNICLGNSGNAITGDSYGTLPSGISLSGTGYQWAYSASSATGPWTDISGATAATYTPTTTVSPFNVAGTYYVIRKAILLSTNNVSPNPYMATNESNVVTLTVNPLPNIGLMVGGTGTICFGTSTNVTVALSVTGTNYQLRNGSSAVGTAVPGTGGTINLPTGSLSSTTTFNVLATIATTSCSAQLTNTATVTITPNNTIVFSSVSGTDDQTVCANTAITNITYTTTGATGATVTGLPAGITGNWDSNIVTISGTPTAFGNFTYTVALSGGCGTITTTGTINVNQLPTANVGSAIAAICQGGTSVSLGGTFGGGATGAIWSAPTGTFTNNTGSTPSTSTFTAAANSTTPITLTLTTIGGSCSTTASKTIVVNPNLPASVSIAASAITICAGTSVTFTATPTNGGAAPTYQWKLNGTNVGTNSPTYTNNALTNGNIVNCVLTSNLSPCSTGSPATSNSLTITVSVAGSWLGTTSTDWNTASNWCGGIPTATTNVVISSGGNQPAIGADAICNNMTINSGATLMINGTNNLTVRGNWINNGTFTANAGLVIFNNAAQTVGTGPFYNLTFGGSGIKTITGTTVTGILSMEGTATFSGAPTYGATATLQYNTATARTAGSEWITPFTATGGIVISGTGTITMNSAKVFGTSVPITINSGSTLNTSISNNYSLTLGGDFHNNGSFSANASPITITGTAPNQSIDGFTTSGTVSMNKTGGTATMQGNISGAGLTINGSGGTLNLGISLSHTFSGNIALTSGTLNGGSSTVHVNSASATAWNGTGTVFVAGTGTVEFGASGNQTISASSTSFYNLNLSNTGASGNNTVTLNSANSVSGTITLSSGILATTTTNILSITNSSSTAISGGSATSYVNGPIKWTLPSSLASGSTYNFPVGKATTYLPFSLVNPTTGTGTVTAQVESFVANSGGIVDAATLNSKSTTEYWSLITTGNFTNSSVSLSRPTTIAPLDAIAASSSITGTYINLAGTAGTTGVTTSNVIGANRFFLLAEQKKSITTLTITDGPFCAGTTGVSIPFTYAPKATFAVATFTAQLSNAAGAFTSPVVLQSVASNGTGSQSLTVTIPVGTTSGTGYRIRIVSSNPVATGSDNGTGLTISSAVPAQPGSITGNTAPCANTAGFTYSVPIVSGVTYTWTFPIGWTQTSGGNSSSVTVTSGSSSGIIEVVPSNACGNGASQTLAVAVAATAITVQPSTVPQSVCQNGTTTAISVTASGTGLYYQWYSNVNNSNIGGATLSGATSSSYTPSSITIGNLYYYCVVTGNCTPAVTSDVSGPVTVVVPQALTTVPSSRCGTGTVILSATSSSCINPTIDWFAAATGGNSLGSGASFTTPSISTTTTYYAQETITGGLATFGVNSSTSLDRGLVFDLSEKIVLSSVQINASAGNVTIGLRNNLGGAVSGVSDVSITAINGIQTVTLNWTIPAGTGYRLLRISGSISLTRTDSYTSWPIGFNVGSITSSIEGGAVNTARYNFFYNWKIARTRVAAKATVGAPVVTGFHGSSCGPGIVEVGASATAGTISWFDALTDGTALATGTTYSPNLNTTTTFYVQSTDGTCTSSPRIAVTASIIAKPTILAGGFGTYCAGSTINLTSTGSGLTNRYWTGPNGFYSLLENPVLTNATLAMTGTYTVIGSALSGVNLVFNGDFESGDIGFVSSYSTSNDLLPEGRYSVVADPKSVHASFITCSDHSPSGTLQMVVNGATVANVNIWSQTVKVVPNTDYQYTYWIQSVVAENPARLQLYINGSPAGPIYTADTPTCSWRQFTYNWNSGASTSAYLSLVNQNIVAGGNDFALDDIVFQPACTTESPLPVFPDPNGTGDEYADKGVIYVTVSAVPTAGAIGTAQTICSGATPAMLTNTTSGTGSGTITYQWQANSGSGYSNIAGATSATYSPSPLTSTTSFQRRTVSNNKGTYCYSAYTTAVTVTVNSSVTANAGGSDPEICQSSSPSALTLSGASVGGSATTGAWSVVSGGGSLSDYSQTSTPALVTYTPSANYSGNVTLRLTTNNVGCTATANRVLVIRPTPTASIGGTTTICQNGTNPNITFTNPVNFPITVTYNINGSNQTTINVGASTTATLAVSTTTTGVFAYNLVSVGYQSGTACSNPVSGTATVTINPILGTPAFSLGATSTRCQGAGSVTYTATAINNTGLTYTFDAASITGGNSIAASTGLVTFTSGWSGTSTITVSASGCSGPKVASHTVTVTPVAGTPTTSTPSNITICQGTGTTNFATSSTNATSYNWSVTGTGNTISGTGTIATVTWAAGYSGTATISVTANGCSGPSASAATNVTVRPTPTASISGTTTICQNGANPGITFTNPQILPVTVTYNINGSNQTTINVGASTTATLSVPTTTTGVFAYNLVSVTYQSGVSCSNSISGTATVTINPLVGTPVFSMGATSTRCQAAGSVTYTATAINNTGLTYTLDAASLTGGNSIAASSGIVNFVSGWSGTSTITVSASGCSGPKVTSHTVTVTPVVGTPSTPTPSNTTICQGTGTTNFATSSTNATSYNWSVTGTGNTISGTGTTATVTWAAGYSGTATISVTANGCSGPSASASTNVTVRTTPTASITGSTTICQNASSPNVVFTNPQSLPITITYNINGTNQTTINVGDNGTSNVAAPTSTAGVFTYNLVSAVYQTLPSCSNALTGSSTITVTPLPSATISYPNSPYCKSLITAQSVTRIGTAGGTYSSLPAGLTLDVNTGAIIPNTSSAGTYTVTYTVAASGGCSIYSTNTSVTIVSVLVWTGAVSTDWNVAGNWSCNVIPDLTTNVLIPNVVNQPILSNGFTGKSKNIVINTGSSLTVSGNTLQVAGTISNSGTFTSSSGTIEMKGSVNQLIPANCFAGNTIMNLNIDNSAGTTLQGTLNISGIVDAINGNLSTGGYLTLISTATQTALIDGSGTGEILGNVNIQRYLPSAFGYKYFSTPFQSATVNGFEPEVNLSATFPPFYKYDENNSIDSSGVTVYTSGWVKYNNPAYALVPLVGYAANFGSLQPSKTIEISGIVNNGNFQVSLFNRNRKYTKGFNLVGNPYPSPIDWDKLGWTKSNIDNAIYFFNAGNTNQYTGVYSSYVNGVSTGNANNIIPAMQGFFVHVTSGDYPVSATFGTTNIVRVNDLNPLFKAAVIDNRPIFRFAVSLETKNAIDDNAVIYFDDNAKKTFEKEVDALKITNTDLLIPNLYSIDPGANKLSINGMQTPIDSISKIPLGIATLSDGWVIFKAKDILQLPVGMNLYLLDSQQDVVQDLKQKPEYRFYLKTGEYNERFALVFSKSDLLKVPDTRRKMFTLSRSSDHINVKVNLPLSVGGNLLVTNMKGQVLLQKKVFEMESVEINSNLSSGVYVITLISESKTESEKILMRKDYE